VKRQTAEPAFRRLERIPKKPVPDLIRDGNRFSDKLRVKSKK